MKLKETEKAEIVINAVLDHYDTDDVTIFAKTRKRHIVQQRQMCQHLMAHYTKLSLEKIGQKTGKRNHATIIHARKTIEMLMDSDNDIYQDYQELKVIIENTFKRVIKTKSFLGLKKLDLYALIRSSSSELEMEQRLIDHFNLNQDLTKMKHLKGALTRAQKKLEKEMHPTIQRVLDLPKSKLDDLIKYKIEPHLKMNA